jgi:large subunit ribosomal protein L10
MKTTVLLALTATTVAAFAPSASTSVRPAMALQGGAAGFATSRDGKQETVAAVQGLLETSDMVFAVSASALTVAESQALRVGMPEGTTVKVVKNTLMARAVAGTDYEAATSLLQGANMWFFVEEDIAATVKAYKAFTKEAGKQETHPFLGGVLEGTVYDAAGVDVIGKLPSKQELYAQIAGRIQAVPTKVARVIKAPNSKVARAIKLAGEQASA